MPSFRHGRIVIQQSDITALAVDAIVCPARPDLAAPEDGVGLAIHETAGPELAAAAAATGAAAEGDARCTPGFLLPASWVVHAIVPSSRGGSDDERALEGCYERSLATAFGAGATTIALPPLAPSWLSKEQSARIAISTTLDFLENHPSLEQVFFCCARAADLDVYLSVADEYL